MGTNKLDLPDFHEGLGMAWARAVDRKKAENPNNRQMDIAVRVGATPDVFTLMKQGAKPTTAEHIALGVDDVALGNGHHGPRISFEVSELGGDGLGLQEVVLADQLDHIGSG